MKERHFHGQELEDRHFWGGSVWPGCGGKAQTRKDGMENSPSQGNHLSKSIGRSISCIPGHGKGQPEKCVLKCKRSFWIGIRHSSQKRRQPPSVLSRGWVLNPILGRLAQQHSEPSGGEKGKRQENQYRERKEEKNGGKREDEQEWKCNKKD